MTRYDDGETYLGVAETAERLLVTPKTVARWAKEGKLPHVKTLGGHRKFPASEIDLIAARLEAEATRDRMAANHGRDPARPWRTNGQGGDAER